MNDKTWGPFSGRQLTTIAVAAMAMAASGTVWAVDAFTNVAIMDPLTGKKAQVDGARRVHTYDLVQGFDELPPNFVRFRASALTTFSCVQLATPPAGKSLIVKTLALNTFTLSSPGAGYVSFHVGTGCVVANEIFGVTPSEYGITDLNIEPGVVVPSGQSLWVVKGTSSISATAYGFGYLVPSSWAPASAVASGSRSGQQAAR